MGFLITAFEYWRDYGDFETIRVSSLADAVVETGTQKRRQVGSVFLKSRDRKTIVTARFFRFESRDRVEYFRYGGRSQKHRVVGESHRVELVDVTVRTETASQVDSNARKVFVEFCSYWPRLIHVHAVHMEREGRTLLGFASQ